MRTKFEVLWVPLDWLRLREHHIQKLIPTTSFYREYMERIQGKYLLYMSCPYISIKSTWFSAPVVSFLFLLTARQTWSWRRHLDHPILSLPGCNDLSQRIKIFKCHLFKINELSILSHTHVQRAVFSFDLCSGMLLIVFKMY